MTADEHIRAQVVDLGRQCEIACAMELLFSMKGEFALAADAADLAAALSVRAFEAVRA